MKEKDLSHAGLLNECYGDLSNVVDINRKRKEDGFCTSYKCTVVETKYITKLGKEGIKRSKRSKKFITNDRSIEECPNCRHILIWKKVK